jgi:hypothetical protein
MPSRASESNEPTLGLPHAGTDPDVQVGPAIRGRPLGAAQRLVALLLQLLLASLQQLQLQLLASLLQLQLQLLASLLQLQLQLLLGQVA